MKNVTTKVKIANLRDLTKSVTVEALVDTGPMVVLPQDIVDSLELEKVEEVTVKSKNYGEPKKIYGVVRLELKGRIGNFDVLAENEGSPPLIGQIVLERLDLVIEPSTKKVMPNPRSPEMPMVEIFCSERLKYPQLI